LRFSDFRAERSAGRPTARVLVLLFRKLASTAKFLKPIGIVPLLIGIVSAGALLAALTLILRHKLRP
jgi:hypothetical protein